ncbi:putative multiple-sugar transport system permease YteP [compost metagenome]|uniref:ABC transporter permease n=1 Tax=Paenibacillus sp. J53TS2 TaxID=2807197 RepID=UPI000F96BD75|nr:ABC transporter permease subunit [Paenibacillus sp. J53TS2]GIP50493.1 sugar ABC transporter permease [Paenibacillus sp. J53TS2]
MHAIRHFFKDFHKNLPILLMVLPGAIGFIIFSYLPMGGTLLAFKQYRYNGEGFLSSFLSSEWVGIRNFTFLFGTNDAYIITRNTLLYNIAFITLGTLAAVIMAILLSEIVNKRLSKLYQTGMFLPHFMSFVIVGFFVYSFLNADKGLLNSVLSGFGLQEISWYATPEYWPYILIITNLWKSIGYTSVVYLAAITGFDRSLYEAAMIDGAGKWRQIRSITIPLLKPLIIIMTLLAIGRIFYADFGLFYNVPRNSGALYPVTNVIDTYVYRGLNATGEMGMATAAGFYQSIIGFILVITSNYTVRKLDKDSALF